MIMAELKQKKSKKIVAPSGEFGSLYIGHMQRTKNYQKLLRINKEIEIMKNKKILIFDLDGTLTESKANLDKEMSALLDKLLTKKIVAVMGGGNYKQFQKQFLDKLKCSKKHLENLFLLPTSGGRMYRYKAGKWQVVYKNSFIKQEKKQIFDAFKKVFKEINYKHPDKIFGKIIEDRESQITFSALGQKALVLKKEEWNKKYNQVRYKIKKHLEKHLPRYKVRLGGLTSIDVTKKGIDKAYGIRQIRKVLNIPVKQMIYIGDALYRGGNDYEVVKTGIDTMKVKDFKETKYLIRKALNSSK